MKKDLHAQLLTTYKQGLLDDTLPFWLPRAIDHEYGGFLTSFDQDGSLIDSDKGVWQQGRFTWLLGELYNEVEPRESWMKAMKHGIEFLERHCFDPVDGRMWFHLTREGEPIRKRRYAFGESFAAIAFGEYFKATGDTVYQDKAIATFQKFVEHSLNPTGEAKYTNVRPMTGIGFFIIALVTAQELRDSVGLDSADQWIDKCLTTIRDDFLKPEIRCVMEAVGQGGDMVASYEGRTLNPGHAIEGAWFVMEEGRYRNDADLVKMGCDMLEWMWERGWDQEFGGLLYFVGVDGKPVQEYWHDMKFWWPHNEAIIATLMAWKLTGRQQYLDWHQQVHDWSYQHFSDHDHGEWFGYLRRDGKVSSTVKGNLWKGPFHFPRMQLLCWQMLEEIEPTN